MARKSRIQYPGALYHVINRGNYRRDVFATVGAAQAFERVMDEACRRFAWRLHAYVIKEYEQFLAELGSDPREQERLGFGRLSRGWAIGTHAWKRELMREYSHIALPVGLDRDERQDLLAQFWNEYLVTSLATHGRMHDEAAAIALDTTWKVTVAAELLDRGVPYRWICRALHMSTPGKVASLVFRLRQRRMA